MKAILTSIVAALGFLALPAFAQEEGGVGIVTGDTNGITVKFPTGDLGALDLAAGIDLDLDASDINPSDGRFRADWHLPLYRVIASGGLEIPFYVGAGAFFELDELDAGLRVPLGLALDFQRVPIEIFAQTGLEARVIDNERDDPGLGLNGAVGIRIKI